MDAAKWSQANHQEIGLMKPMEEIVTSCNDSSGACTAAARPGAVAMERKARPPEQLNCPRCNSTNTKFCYYNNYSLTQPRYFCKTCRRYWTEGGSLRNVPVGGGSRKNKRSSSSFSSPQQQAAAANSSHHHPPPRVIPDLNPPNNINNLSVHFSSSHQSPVADRMQKGQDLNLAFPAMQETHQAMSHHFLQITPKMENSNNATSAHHQQHQHHQENNSSSSPAHQSLPYDHHPSQLSALELLRTGMATRGLNSFLPGQVIDSNALYNSSGFSMHDYKPNLGFTIENGLGNRADNNNGGGGGGRINFFPFGEMKQINSGTSDEVEHHQGNKSQQGNSSAGEYWSNNGVLGGGPW